ncbi:kelch-like protein 18 [Ctenocephalides felis]|uniref:kelch-like protein 18 n=1 Tax=Ctenocephalides felis TaxID=7515 RepID=UPI000E6E340C|nr:kelch-like protein 18 [Ctenocephalides felis]XP_026466649.1 kelch-like protein 18 [Ctenocephalides felis]
MCDTISMEVADDEDCSYFQQSELFAEGLTVMEEIRRQGKLCDVTLKVEDQSFSAHRIVLAASIPYFYAMFTHNMVESKKRDIVMKGIEPKALETLINFAYSGKVTISNRNVQSLMVGASFLQLTKVRDACADFLKMRFHPHNVLGIRQFAETLGCTKLKTHADIYLAQFFHEVCLSDEFLLLSNTEVLNIIQCDGLDISSESEVFEALMGWIGHNPDERQQYLPELLAHIRLPLLPPQYLADRVATEEMIRTSHKCRDLLDEAKDYHLMPERRSLIPRFRTQPRVFEYSIGHIYAVGGLTKNGDSVSAVETFDPKLGQWQIGEAMCMMRSRVGVAVSKGRLYAFGGFNGTERLKTVEIYDPVLKRWEKGSPMQYKRSAVGVATLGNLIYVCGGYDGITSLNTVECYNPNTDTWKLISPMIKYRSAGGVASLSGYIWALGGHDGLSIFDSVERYDPRTDTWVKMESMLTRRCRLGVAPLNGKLYVCGGYDGSKFLQTVEMFDPVTNSWSFVAPMNVMRSRVALVANMGKLWAIGGYDGESNLSTVEVYDPIANEWSMAPAMCAHEGGVGAAVVPVI